MQMDTLDRAELYQSMYGTLDSIILNMYHFFDSIPGDKQSILYYVEDNQRSPGRVNSRQNRVRYLGRMSGRV